MGYQLLKNNILFPFTGSEEIVQRQAAIEHLIDRKLTGKISHSLKNCIDIDANEFIFFKENKSEYFIKMYKMLSSVLVIVDLLRGHGGVYDVPDTLKCYGDICTYKDLIKNIERKINFKEDRFNIRPAVSDELDFLKNQYSDLENRLSEVV
ncbi:putative DNA mismatch repair protein MutS, core protein, partial [Trachipleistophora hominis]